MRTFKKLQRKVRPGSEDKHTEARQSQADHASDTDQTLEDFYSWMRGGRSPLNIDTQSGSMIMESPLAYPFPVEIEQARLQAATGRPITWAEVQAREDLWERLNQESERSRGRPARKGLCRVCRAIKLLDGDRFSSNKDVQFVPFGNATQIVCRARHCAVCSCVLELITCGSSSIHASFAGVHEDVEGTQLHPQVLASGEVVLGVDYSLRRVGAIRILDQANAMQVIRQEHDIGSAAADPDGGNPITSTGPTRQMVSKVRLKNWLQECEATHGRMCNSENPALVRQDEMRILLIDVNERRLTAATTTAKYFALSYVWGKEPLPVTLVNNFESRCLVDGLKDTSVTLPQTIEDAINLVLDLGERYLWVDALCIIQDDQVAKHQQIQRMDRIYSEAYATIVALSGDKADSGLPGIRGGTRPPQQLHHIDSLSMVATPPPLKYVLDGSKWDSRAWTFQERMLSRRCLFFTRNHVYFQCAMKVLCETGGDIIAGGEKSSLHINPLLSYISGLSETVDDSLDANQSSWEVNDTPVNASNDDGWETDESDDSKESATARESRLASSALRANAQQSENLGRQFNFELYEALVRAYTKRELSYVADIGNAFAGLEAVLKKLFHTTLIHGLPADALDLALFWTPVSTVDRRYVVLGENPPTDELFPSWSWMGWVGGVNYLIAKEEEDDYAVPEVGQFRICHQETSFIVERRTWTKTASYKPSQMLQFLPDWVKRPSSPPRDVEHLFKSLPSLSSLSITRNSLQFWTQCIPASELYIRDGPIIYLASATHGLSKGEQGVQRLMNQKNQHCGMLFHTSETEVLNAPEKQRYFVLLSRYKDGEERRMEMSTTAGSLRIWDHKAFGRAMSGNSLLNLMLIERCGTEAIFRRVSVAQIHSRAWDSLGYKVEFITLI